MVLVATSVANCGRIKIFLWTEANLKNKMSTEVMFLLDFGSHSRYLDNVFRVGITTRYLFLRISLQSDGAAQELIINVALPWNEMEHPRRSLKIML